MKAAFRVILLCFTISISSSAGEFVIGIQNGIGESFENGRNDVDNLWGYRGNVYLGIELFRNLTIQPSFYFSQKGAISKLYGSNVDENGVLITDYNNYLEIPERSQICGFALGVKPNIDINRINLSLLVGPRIDYIYKKIIDNSSLGVENREFKPKINWIPGLNVDIGCAYKLSPLLIGIVFNNEIDFKDDMIYGESFRVYKYSIMVDVGYEFGRK
jgi:hypothetical protein